MLQMLFGYACDCANNGPFLQIMKDDEVGVVAVVKVKAFSNFKTNRYDTTIRFPTTMEVEVLTDYKGKERRKILTVWGNTGNTCMENLTAFRQDERYLMALIKVKPTSKKEDEKNDDYLIAICGTYWLNVAPGNVAIGNIDGKITSISLKKLSELIISTLR
jgi:hypothetical protein